MTPNHIHGTTVFAPLLAIVGSITSLGIGSAWAKHSLFPLIGAQGTTAIRVGLSAMVVLALWRPWRWVLTRSELVSVIGYGSMLGAMNLCFYLSLQTLPFGVAVAIEFAGPLTVAIVFSRRLVDFLWIGLALVGLAILLPLGHGVSTLDPMGVIFALLAAICWAAYIVFGKHIGHLDSGHSVSLGLAMAALIVVPVGVAHAGGLLLSPYVLAVGLCVAIVSSALPIFLEMYALRRLPPQGFAVMISMEPAVAALVGLFWLSEQLSIAQWAAIAMIVAASIGSGLTTKR